MNFFNSIPLPHVGIVTSAPRLICLSRLKHVGLRTDMALISSESVKRGKPDPEGFLLGASSLNIKPENCIVFEDSIAGIIAAKSAGMKVIALETTHHASELTDADLVIQSYDELHLEKTSLGFLITKIN